MASSDDDDGRVVNLFGPQGSAHITPCGPCSVRHLTLCSALSPEDLQHFAAIVSDVQLGPGQSLFMEEEPALHVFIVTTGTLSIDKLLADGRRQVVGFLFKGDYLGFALGETYTYNAEAVTHATLCRFRKNELGELLGRFPQLERQLFGMANHELAAAQDKMVILGCKTAREKIVSFLLMLLKRTPQNSDSDNTVMIPMTRTHIGDYLGLTTETVSRTFTILKRERLVEVEPGKSVRLLSVAALTEIAGGF